MTSLMTPAPEGAAAQEVPPAAASGLPAGADTDAGQPARRAAGRRAAEKVLEAAEQEFASYGFHGTRVAAIAKRAGLPKANLLYYFSTKQALYEQVLLDILETWLGQADDIRAGNSAREGLSAYIRGKMRVSLERPHASKVWANEILAGGEAVAGMVRATLIPWMEAKQQVIETWISRGELRPIDPRTLFYTIWAATQHWADFAAQICLVEGKEKLEEADIARASDSIVSLVLDGIATPPAGSVKAG